jgi:hypothetical protein
MAVSRRDNSDCQEPDKDTANLNHIQWLSEDSHCGYGRNKRT